MTKWFTVSAGFLLLSGMQSPIGSIAGRVQDEGCGGLSGATVRININGMPRETIADREGRFRIGQLPPGRYSAEANFPSWPVKQSWLTITPGNETAWNPIVLAIRYDARPEHIPSTEDSGDADLTRSVYEAIVRSLRPKPKGLAVETVSLQLPGYLDESWPPSLNRVPRALRDAVTTADARKLVLLRKDSVPLGAALVKPLSDDPPCRERSNAQRASLLKLSKVFMTTEGNDAIVFFHHRCGDYCGQAALTWLRRSSRRQWTIAGQEVYFTFVRVN
jgi:hypothetical protein